MQSNPKLSILSSPLFVCGTALLLLNDHVFKMAYGTWLTGKLSDFAGLFVFPLFVGTFLHKKYRLWAFITVGLLFVLWKLPVSDAFVAGANRSGIPLARTVDPTDLVALSILPFSHRYQERIFLTWRHFRYPMLLISSFAFVATTMPPKKQVKYVQVDKTYEFDFSREVLIAKLNRISLQKMGGAQLQALAGFDSESDAFYSIWNGDTLAIMLDSKKLTAWDTIHYKAVLADFLIDGDQKESSLKFITAYKMVPEPSDAEYRNKAIRYFERKVVKPLLQKELP